MSPSSFESASLCNSVRLSETHIEPLQLVGRIGHSAFLVGGSANNGQMTSGPNPYDLLAASLAACTVMTVRLYADRKGISIRHISASVAFRRGARGTPDVFERSLTIEAVDLDPEIETRLRNIASMCPVARTLARTSEVHDMPAGERPTVPSSSTDYVSHVEELPIPNVDW